MGAAGSVMSDALPEEFRELAMDIERQKNFIRVSDASFIETEAPKMFKNHAKLIETLTARTKSQIRCLYTELPQSLRHMENIATSGNPYARFLAKLHLSKLEIDMQSLRDLVVGFDEEAMVGILGMSTQDDLYALNQLYYDSYAHSLHEFLQSHLASQSSVRKFVDLIFQFRRDESKQIDENMAVKQAKLLFKALSATTAPSPFSSNGQNYSLGAQEDVILNTLAVSSRAQCLCIAQKFFEKYEQKLDRMIHLKCKGSLAWLLALWIAPIPSAVAIWCHHLLLRMQVDRESVMWLIAKCDKDLLALANAAARELFGGQTLAELLKRGGITGHLHAALKQWIEAPSPDRGLEKILELVLQGKVSSSTTAAASDSLLDSPEMRRKVHMLLDKQCQALRSFVSEHMHDPDEPLDATASSTSSRTVGFSWHSARLTSASPSNAAAASANASGLSLSSRLSPMSPAVGTATTPSSTAAFFASPRQQPLQPIPVAEGAHGEEEEEEDDDEGGIFSTYRQHVSSKNASSLPHSSARLLPPLDPPNDSNEKSATEEKDSFADQAALQQQQSLKKKAIDAVYEDILVPHFAQHDVAQRAFLTAEVFWRTLRTLPLHRFGLQSAKAADKLQRAGETSWVTMDEVEVDEDDDGCVDAKDERKDEVQMEGKEQAEGKEAKDEAAGSKEDAKGSVSSGAEAQSVEGSRAEDKQVAGEGNAESKSATVSAATAAMDIDQKDEPVAEHPPEESKAEEKSSTVVTTIRRRWQSVAVVYYYEALLELADILVYAVSTRTDRGERDVLQLVASLSREMKQAAEEGSTAAPNTDTGAAAEGEAVDKYQGLLDTPPKPSIDVAASASPAVLPRVQSRFAFLMNHNGSGHHPHAQSSHSLSSTSSHNKSYHKHRRGSRPQDEETKDVGAAEAGLFDEHHYTQVEDEHDEEDHDPEADLGYVPPYVEQFLLDTVLTCCAQCAVQQPQPQPQPQPSPGRTTSSSSRQSSRQTAQQAQALALAQRTLHNESFSSFYNGLGAEDRVSIEALQLLITTLQIPGLGLQHFYPSNNTSFAQQQRSQLTPSSSLGPAGNRPLGNNNSHNNSGQRLSPKYRLLSSRQVVETLIDIIAPWFSPRCKQQQEDHYLCLVDAQSGAYFWFNTRDESSQWVSDASGGAQHQHQHGSSTGAAGAEDEDEEEDGKAADHEDETEHQHEEDHHDGHHDDVHHDDHYEGHQEEEEDDRNLVQRTAASDVPQAVVVMAVAVAEVVGGDYFDDGDEDFDPDRPQNNTSYDYDEQGNYVVVAEAIPVDADPDHLLSLRRRNNNNGNGNASEQRPSRSSTVDNEGGSGRSGRQQQTVVQVDASYVRALPQPLSPLGSIGVPALSTQQRSSSSQNHTPTAVSTSTDATGAATAVSPRATSSTVSPRHHIPSQQQPEPQPDPHIDQQQPPLSSRSRAEVSADGDAQPKSPRSSVATTSGGQSKTGSSTAQQFMLHGDLKLSLSVSAPTLSPAVASASSSSASAAEAKTSARNEDSRGAGSQDKKGEGKAYK